MVSPLLHGVLFAVGALVGARAMRSWSRMSSAREPEIALRRTDVWLRALFEANVVPFMCWRSDGRITEANEAFLRLVGASREEVKSGKLQWSDLTPPEWRSVDVRIASDVTAIGRFSPVQKEYLRRDGTRVPVLLGGAAVPGSHDRGITFAIDLSDQKRAEEKLALELETRRVIADSTSGALFMVDEGERCTFMNPAAEEMTGFTLADIGDRSIHELLHHHHPDGRPFPIDECPIACASRAGVALRNHEDTFVRKDGELFPVVCKVSPVKGHAHGVSVVEVTDLSERKRAERDREALLDSERAARAEAERASRLKDEFVATLSHELRTPLNAILGWAEMLRAAPRTPERLAHGLEVIERNARLQAQLISDLLDVSRIARGKLRLEATAVDLAAIVEGAIEGLRGTATAKGVTVNAGLAPLGAAVTGDGCRLSQVVSNLVSNAIKFTPAGGKVVVNLRPLGSSAELSVTDTGVGISAEFLPSLFERFRQADASAARQHGGLGLGLSIVKHLVELHGGRVHAESDGLGKGARFVVVLPMEGPERARDGGAHPTRVRVLTDTCLEGVSVLVVDDEPDAREIAQHVLEDCDALVATACSAEEALAVACAAPPDVVVSDISMPGVDGYQLMRRIRGLPEPVCAVPAVALTAFARNEDRARALEAGFQMHLSKPVDPGELAAAVASLARR
jgi:PAS domain S-box-containing protein